MIGSRTPGSQVVRRGLTHTRFSALALLVAVSYVLARIFQWVLSLPVIFGPDSHSFVPGPGLTGMPNGYFGFEKVSLTGEGVIRPWTVTLPYALLGADFVRSFAQMLFSAGSYLFLAWVLSRVVRPPKLGASLGIGVLMASMTTLVASWDMLINRESIAISLTALFLGLAVLAIRDMRWRIYLAANLVALLLTVTRPTIAPLTVGVLVVLLLVRVCQSRNLDKSQQLLSALVGVLLLVISVIYPAWISTRIDGSWADWYGHTMSETQFGYVMADYNPRAESLIEPLRQSGAPECLLEAIPVDTSEYLGAPWGFAADRNANCPGFTEWFSNSWPSWYYGYLASNPDYVAKLAVSGLPLALHPWDNGATTSLVPASLRNLIFPSLEGEEFLGTYDPLFLYWAIFLGTALIAMVVARGKWRQLWSKSWEWILFFLAVITGSLTSIIANLLLIPSYPLETNRINVSTALTLRFLGVVLAVLVVFKFVDYLKNQKSKSQRPGTEKESDYTSQ